MRLSTQRFALYVFILVAISVGTWISGLFPAPQDVLDRPYLRAAEGLSGHSERIGTVTVTAVETQAQWQEQPTQGIFLVVSLAAEVPEPVGLDATLIDAEGRSVHRHALSRCGVQQPGLPTPCQLAFEMDPSAVAGARLHVARDNVLAEREFLVFDLAAEALP
ncbi:hypothetical protein [Corynebacterium sp.]|uniref:hypothetical protein n=1 Tax=Corynebacterium sp. TaxID=1720 RepID=UPI0026E01CB9|nr:hypothetical protein [Corynebacterium sp.]MDO5512393.1 hypothetical protein [Corynebacterium sp.]